MTTMTTSIERLPIGINIVTHYFGEGESWHRYVVCPRRLLLELVRTKRIRKCPSWNGPVLLQLFAMLEDQHDTHLLTCGYESDAGQAFATEPRIYHSNRRAVTFHQRGGWDI